MLRLPFCFKGRMQIRLLGLLILIGVPGDSVAQIATGKCKFLGNIIASTTPADFTLYWNQVTPENAGKWGSVERSRDVMDWTELDNAYNTAINNGFLFKLHTLVWGNQQPEWISSLSAAEQKEEVEEWIQLVCERYPETDFIDVVNEPLHAPPSYKDALGGNGLTGWNWVVWTFEKARQYCPNAKLFLNDYNVISNNAATNSYLQIINLLESKGLLDGIGEQGHFLESAPLSTLQANLDKLAATELPIHISEFDVNIADDTQQKNKYEELFAALWNNDAVEGITLWGYRQGQIWRENAYLIRSAGTLRPAFTWLAGYVGNTAVSCEPVATLEAQDPIYDVFPNPSSGGQFSVTISLPGYNLEIIDVRGKVAHRIEKISVGVHTVVTGLGPGAYILKLSGRNGKHFAKIITY